MKCKLFSLVFSIIFVLASSTSAFALSYSTDLFLSTSSGPLAVYGTSTDSTTWNLLVVNSYIEGPDAAVLASTNSTTRGYCTGATSCSSDVIYYYGFDPMSNYTGRSIHEFHNNFDHFVEASLDITL